MGGSSPLWGYRWEKLISSGGDRGVSGEDHDSENDDENDGEGYEPDGQEGLTREKKQASEQEIEHC